MKEGTLALFMLTQHYKVFTEVVKKIMNNIGCHTGPEVRELTLEQVEYMENSIQCIGAGGIYGVQHPVHCGRWNMWSTSNRSVWLASFLLRLVKHNFR